jgi:acetyl esterase/lipase
VNKKIKKGCGCLLGAVLLIAVAGAIALYVFRPKWHDEYGERYKDIAYGSREHNTYDLYLPHDAATNDSLALILFIHGGAWISGDKSLREFDCYPLVQKGYVAATMNYSLLTEDETSLITMLDEIEACILHIMSFAEGKGLHIRQMSIGGTSAGGHLAMMFAYTRQHPIPIKFEVIRVGPSDFRILFPYDKNAKQKPEEVRDFVFACTGKHTDITSLTPEEADSIKLLASPISFISDSTALPAIFAYGEKDDIVKPGHYHALQAMYDSLGKPYDLIVYPNSNHFLMGDKDCTERYDSTLADYCKKYFGY